MGFFKHLNAIVNSIVDLWERDDIDQRLKGHVFEHDKFVAFVKRRAEVNSELDLDCGPGTQNITINLKLAPNPNLTLTPKKLLQKAARTHSLNSTLKRTFIISDWVSVLTEVDGYANNISPELGPGSVARMAEPMTHLYLSFPTHIVSARGHQYN